MDPNATTVEHHDSMTGRTYTTRHRGHDAARRAARNAHHDWTPVATVRAIIRARRQRRVLARIAKAFAGIDFNVKTATLTFTALGFAFKPLHWPEDVDR